MRTVVLIGLLSLGIAGYAPFDSQLGGFAVELLARDRQEKPQEPFVPRSGQPGKDVVWVPSPPEMVSKMLEIAKVTPADYVIDLGSGDGRNIIAAAKLGARGHGVEYNPDMVALSQKLAKEAGVADKAQFIQGDMYEADISKATVMALFLLPVNLNKLHPKFLNLAPGSRIVANTFGIDGWEPDYRTSLPQGSDCESWCDVLLWIVPAKVAGTWIMPNGRLVLTQENQMVQGTATINGETLTLTKGRMDGEDIMFVAGAQVFNGKVKGSRIEGTITTSSGPVSWSATKQ
jgi:SAM-dependent methyltransferase